MKKCGIVTMINSYQSYNFKQHFDSSKLHEKSWKERNSTKMRNPKRKEKLGRRLINLYYNVSLNQRHIQKYKKISKMT